MNRRSAHRYEWVDSLEPRHLLAGTGNRLEILSTLPGGVINPGGLVRAGGIFYFYATDAAHGREVWRTDGTQAGTFLLRDINPGPNQSVTTDDVARVFQVLGGTLFFAADDGVHGYELWKSDGTAAGTSLVRDINPGAGSSLQGFPSLVTASGVLYFTATDGTSGRDVWKTDGTEAGTQLAADLPSGADGYGAREYFSLNGADYFLTQSYFGSGGGLWVLDGSPTGATLLSGFFNQGSSYERMNEPTRLGDPAPKNESSMIAGHRVHCS